MKADKIIGAVQGVTKKWTKQRKKEERDAAAALNRRYAMTHRRSVSIRDAAFSIMERAYLKASANGSLPAHARQIMYAARPYIQQHADKELGQRFDQHFTQQLLPEYIEAWGVTWNVVYDARGNFTEPHTKTKVPLGTLQVRGYLAAIRQHKIKDPKFEIWEKFYPTLGPKHRFGAILFIEKEGFMPLFESVQLAERYDLAIMWTKGMSVTAARKLVEQLCAVYAVPLLGPLVRPLTRREEIGAEREPRRLSARPQTWPSPPLPPRALRFSAVAGPVTNESYRKYQVTDQSGIDSISYFRSFLPCQIPNVHLEHRV